MGGYSTDNFSGTLSANPDYKTNGNLGAFDASSPHPSIYSYLPGWNGNLASWGWEYKTSQNGTWVNASAGNSGDIIN
jgi:hypothetical protein